LSLGSTATEGTALRGESGAQPKNFVFVYNNIEGTGRPLSGTFVEADETANTAGNNYSAFYANNVNGVAGAYGLVIPNTLAAGVRRVEVRELTTGDLAGCSSADADGIWPSGANTVNPNTGTTAKVFTNADAPLAPSPEVCDNLIDDDCDGLVDEACPGNFSNDAPGGAPNVQYSVNMNYPNCYPISGNNTLANNSVESGAFDGPDSWYRFVAQSTGVSITMTSATMDDAIALYSRNGLVYTLVASEDASSGTGDFERLNFNGLTVGQTYYISAGASSGPGGAFSLCIQHLMPSGCSSVEPVGGFSLCDTYKARYRGAPSQGVTYTFSFTGIGGGATGTTTLSGTNGVTTLSNGTLALRWGGEYDVQVDVRYNLLNSAGTAEPMDVLGSSSSPNCSAVTVRAHPALEVRSTQRCPSTLLRSNFLVGDRVVATSPICGVLNYTYEFTQVTSCEDGTVVSVVPSTFNTVASTPYLALGVLPNLSAPGAWDVRIRPNFSYGVGVYGPVQRIRVNGTSAAAMLDETAELTERSITDFTVTELFPNPANGSSVWLNVGNLISEQIELRVLDMTGRVVLSQQYFVEGSLQTEISVADLSNGMYVVELMDGDIKRDLRLVIQH
ncbi:MAG: T9SS type A sorting domain-containing protein, partial [Flavobacteriales bacterium]